MYAWCVEQNHNDPIDPSTIDFSRSVEEEQDHNSQDNNHNDSKSKKKKDKKKSKAREYF